MRGLPLIFAIAFALAACTRSNAGEHPAPAKPVGTEPVILHADQIHNLLIARGVLTTLKFSCGKPIDDLRIGDSRIFEAKLEEDGQRILLKAIAGDGATNMTVTIDNVDYVFVIQVTPDPSKVVFTRTYSLGTGTQEELLSDLMRIGRAPKLKPAQIDAAALARKVQRAVIDPVYRKALPDFRIFEINRPYVWKKCVVQLMAAYGFVDSDIVLLKVEWVNTTGTGIYLNSRQLGVRCAGKKALSIASHQDSLDSWVLPGQLDTVWLVIHGEKIAYANDWDLRFPN